MNKYNVLNIFIKINLILKNNYKVFFIIDYWHVSSIIVICLH